MKYMEKEIVIINVAIFIGAFIASVFGKDHHIEERALVFTPATVIQVTFGASFPAQLRKRTISLDFAIQQNFNMPTNYSQNYPPIIAQRSIDMDDIDRVTLYKYFMELLENAGLDGERCLLRSICEIGQYPMHVEDIDSVLERIVHYVFTPSEDIFEDSNDVDREEFIIDDRNSEFYDHILRAEFLGKTQGQCSDEFSECTLSVVSLFTKLFFT